MTDGLSTPHPSGRRAVLELTVNNHPGVMSQARYLVNKYGRCSTWERTKETTRRTEALSRLRRHNLNEDLPHCHDLSHSVTSLLARSGSETVFLVLKVDTNRR